MMFFNFDEIAFTVLRDKKGISWWVAKEVCDYLDLKNSSVAIRALPDDYKQQITIEAFKTGGRGGDNGKRIIINESGLYRLISRQPCSTGREVMAYKYTFIFKGGHKTKKLTGMSAIREKCLECSNWQFKEVRLCPSKDCALYPFKFGKYPKNRVAGQRFLNDLGAGIPE